MSNIIEFSPGVRHYAKHLRAIMSCMYGAGVSVILEVIRDCLSLSAAVLF